MDIGSFLPKFQEFVKETNINSVEVEEVEKLENVESYRQHGDTEYHYTIMPSMNGWKLTVQERDYNDERQNLEDKHWTDFATRSTIGRSGLLMPVK